MGITIIKIRMRKNKLNKNGFFIFFRSGVQNFCVYVCQQY
jgi:hypothetical protein